MKYVIISHLQSGSKKKKNLHSKKVIDTRWLHPGLQKTGGEPVFCIYTPFQLDISLIFFYNGFEQQLGRERFKKLFPVILTDNGSEFSTQRPLSIALRSTMANAHGFIIAMLDALTRKARLKSTLVQSVIPKAASRF